MTQVERIIQGLMLLQQLDPDVEIVQTGEGIGADIIVPVDRITFARLHHLGWDNTDDWWTFELH